jgi:hypothetical protein
MRDVKLANEDNVTARRLAASLVMIAIWPRFARRRQVTGFAQ